MPVLISWNKQYGPFVEFSFDKINRDLQSQILRDSRSCLAMDSSGHRVDRLSHLPQVAHHAAGADADRFPPSLSRLACCGSWGILSASCP